MAVGLGEPPESKKGTEVSTNGDGKTTSKDGSNALKRTDSSDMIFTLEEEHFTDINAGQKSSAANQPHNNVNSLSGLQITTNGKTAWQSGVDMTPLAGVPGARVLRYLGNLDYIFVRESTSIREHGGLSGFLHGFITEVCQSEHFYKL